MVFVQDHPYAGELGDVVATVIDLITAETDEGLHTAGAPTDGLADLVADARTVAQRFIGSEAWTYTQGWANAFLRFRGPRRGKACDPDDSTVRYVRPLTGEASADEPLTRDDWLLTAAIVRAYATVVEPPAPANAAEPAGEHWNLYRAVMAQVWPTPTDAYAVQRIADNIATAFDARYTRRRIPTEQTKIEAPVPAPPSPGGEMSATLEALMTVKKYTDAVKDKDRATAQAAIDEGRRDHADAALPIGPGRVATWADLQTNLDALLPQPMAEPAPEATTEHDANCGHPHDDDTTVLIRAGADSGRLEVIHVQGPPPAPPAPEPAPVPAAAAPEAQPGPYALRITHRVGEGTRLLDDFGDRDETAKKALSAIMGKGGQKWVWHRVSKYWYVARSMNTGANVVRIADAVEAISAHPLFTVTTDIDSTGPDGKPVAPYVTKSAQAEKRRRWQRAFDALAWKLHTTRGGLRCAHCATMVTTATARIIADGEGMPDAACAEHADATSLRVGINLNPEPTGTPAVEASTVPAPPAAPAADARGVESLTVDELIALVATGDPAAIAEAGRRMTQPVPPPRSRQAPRAVPRPAPPAARARVKAEPTPAPVPLPAPAPEPKLGPPTDTLYGVAPGARLRALARDLRSVLNTHVARNPKVNGGERIEIHVYADRESRTLTVRAGVPAGDGLFAPLPPLVASAIQARTTAMAGVTTI